MGLYGLIEKVKHLEEVLSYAKSKKCDAESIKKVKNTLKEKHDYIKLWIKKEYSGISGN